MMAQLYKLVVCQYASNADNYEDIVRFLAKSH
jgi:hypothetical protein